MKWQCKLVFIIYILIIGCEADDIPTLPIEINEATHTIEEEEATDKLNEYRLDNNLKELDTDEESQIEAQQHTKNMLDRGEVSHEGYPTRRIKLLNHKAGRGKL